MTVLHDTFAGMEQATLTERGQISIPAELRRLMHLQPGARLAFAQVSDNEFRVYRQDATAQGPRAALGWARRLRPGQGRTTAEWMRELREGERTR